MDHQVDILQWGFPKSGLEKVLRLCIKTCTQTGPKSIAQSGVGAHQGPKNSRTLQNNMTVSTTEFWEIISTAKAKIRI